MKSWPGSSAVVLAQFLSTQQHLLGKPAFSPQVVHFPVEPRISAKDPQSFMRISANDPQSFKNGRVLWAYEPPRDALLAPLTYPGVGLDPEKQ